MESLAKDENLPSVFQALGSIAQHSLPVWETKENEVIKFVLRDVFKRPSVSHHVPTHLNLSESRPPLAAVLSPGVTGGRRVGASKGD